MKKTTFLLLFSWLLSTGFGNLCWGQSLEERLELGSIQPAQFRVEIPFEFRMGLLIIH